MRNSLLLLLLFVICACGGGFNRSGSGFSEREAYRYDNALRDVERLEEMLEEAEAEPTQEGILAMLTHARGLSYEYNDNGMSDENILRCNALKMRIENCQQRAVSFTEQIIVSAKSINVLNVPEQLLTEREYYPVYLKKGEKLFCGIEASAVLSAKLYNADTERLVKSYKSSKVSDSLLVANSGVYLLELTPQGKMYASVSLGVRPTDTSGIYNRPVVSTEQVECKKNDLGAVGVPGIEMRRAFEEPRKFTLRGQFKATFSGNSKALVAVPVPAGATDVLYSMRIATSESARSGDGEFHDNLTRSYKRIKFMGLPLYERSSSNGLLNTLLDDNRPIRDEDAYCNMYVFRNKNEAKKFQDGTKPASQLNYDVDYSTVGTQSCNGRVPVNGAKTIYLAFENERMRYTNYLWVEVEIVVPNTVYYRTKYSVD